MKHVILILPLVTGCDALQEFLPTVQFDRFDVQDIDFEHFNADFVFEVDNPNPIEVGLASFDYAFALADVDLLEGDNTDGFTLEASDASELVLPVDMTWVDAWNTAQATRGLDRVPFGLSGHFGFGTPLGPVELPYDEDGSFPALRTPKFRFKKVRVENLNVLNQTARLEVDLGIDNDHRSTLFFTDFDYAVTMDGVLVGQGLISDLGGVEGATEGSAVLPLTVNLISLGTELVQAITQRDPIQLGLTADMDVDTPFGLLPLHLDEEGLTPLQ